MTHNRHGDDTPSDAREDRETMVSIKGLSKAFCRSHKRQMYYMGADILRQFLCRDADQTTLRPGEFWAVRNISFDIRRGEGVGLVGPNGAGKSTLLSLVNGIGRPSAGTVTVRGKIGALLQLGAGFNPTLTGRENCYVYGAILGFSRPELSARLPEIFDFAEIGDAIDAPLETYSSGMKVRLGFAVAAIMDPDILLVDEVLAVGDSSFRQRCKDWFADYRIRKGTMFLVSHNTNIIQEVCARAIYLNNGEVVADGLPADVVFEYERYALRKASAAANRMRKYRAGAPQDEEAPDPIELTEFELTDRHGVPIEAVPYLGECRLKIRYSARQTLKDPYFYVEILKEHQEFSCATFSTYYLDCEDFEVAGGGAVEVAIPSMTLTPGIYRVRASILNETTAKLSGKKYLLPQQIIGEFIVDPGDLPKRLPRAPATSLVKTLPPAMFDHQWIIDGNRIAEFTNHRAAGPSEDFMSAPSKARKSHGV